MKLPHGTNFAVGGNVLPARLWGKLAVSGLMAVLLLGGCTGAPAGGQKAPEVEQPSKVQTPVSSEPVAATEVTVYFGNETADKLVAVKRPVPKGETPMNAAIEALIAGPSAGEKLAGVMPPGTRLLQLSVTEGNAHVNLSHEFRDNHPGGSTGEILTLYALANTLSEFPQVQTVRIWVEGKPLQTFIHMDLQQGLQRRPDLIAAKP